MSLIRQHELRKQQLLNSQSVNPFFLDTNGVTIKLKSGFSAGVTGLADGDTSGTIYTAVDQAMFNALDPNTDDYTIICTTLVSDMSFAFKNTLFNQDISHFDTFNVTSMFEMFFNATSFNQPLNNWDVSNVTTMFRMFENANSFNQLLNNWDVSNVIGMRNMFTDATSFNQPLNNWDVSNVINMVRMFENTPFNQPLNNWNVSNVNNMFSMFLNASNFNQDLTGWCVINIPTEPTDFSTGSALTPANKPIWGTCP